MNFADFSCLPVVNGRVTRQSVLPPSGFDVFHAGISSFTRFSRAPMPIPAFGEIIHDDNSITSCGLLSVE